MQAQRLFGNDLDTLQAFCRLAQPQLAPVFEEIRLQFKTEFDYREEAQNMLKGPQFTCLPSAKVHILTSKCWR